MHIIGLIVAFLIGIGFLLWKLNRGMQAGKQIYESARDAKAAVRSHMWRHRSAERPLDAIDDPMLIAAVVLVLSIRCDRDVTQEDRAKLTGEMARVFQVDQAMAEDLQGEAEYLVRDVTDFPRWAGRMAARLVPLCTADERAQVLEMADALAAGSAPSHRRNDVLARYRDNARLS